MAGSAPTWLEAVELTKRYGGVLALDRASVVACAGQVHGLVGVNGAGKSTLVKCLTGMVRPTGGSVLVDGRSLPLGRPVDSLRAGIASVPQELTVAPTLTVAENIMLGHEPRGPFGWVRKREARRRAKDALASVSLDVPLSAPVGQLPLIEQRLVMIARALSFSARLVIFDEPTATVSPHEAALLLETVRSLAARRVSVLYVSHHLREIEAVCDSVTVLRDGRIIADLERATHLTLVDLLAPDRVSEPRVVREERSPREVVLEARSVWGPRLRDVSLAVGAGEIVGLAGLIGAGRSELARAIYGAVEHLGGETLAGTTSLGGSPVDSIRAGVALIPESRKDDGLLLRRPIRENVSLASLAGLHRLGFIRGRAERVQVAGALARVSGTSLLEAPAGALSGGNQQKLLFARALLAKPSVLIADEPTRGVDVGAKLDLYQLLVDLAAGGVAILLISNEMEELLGLAHRVVVMRKGRVAAELAGPAMTEAAILAAAFGTGGTGGTAAA